MKQESLEIIQKFGRGEITLEEAKQKAQELDDADLMRILESIHL